MPQPCLLIPAYGSWKNRFHSSVQHFCATVFDSTQLSDIAGSEILTVLLVKKSTRSIFWGITSCKPNKEIVWSRQRTCFLLGLLFCPDDRGDMFLRNVSWLSLNYSALCPRRWHSLSDAVLMAVHVSHCGPFCNTRGITSVSPDTATLPDLLLESSFATSL
jgi:hypothetical protein